MVETTVCLLEADTSKKGCSILPNTFVVV